VQQEVQEHLVLAEPVVMVEALVREPLVQQALLAELAVREQTVVQETPVELVELVELH
jgi:hypothetical protein